MSDLDPERFTLRQVDQARGDFAAIESDLQFIMGQLARLPDRAYVSRLVAMATTGLAALIVAVALILVALGSASCWCRLGRIASEGPELRAFGRIAVVVVVLGRGAALGWQYLRDSDAETGRSAAQS